MHINTKDNLFQNKSSCIEVLARFTVYFNEGMLKHVQTSGPRLKFKFISILKFLIKCMGISFCTEGPFHFFS